MEKVVRTVCQASHSECGVLVHVKDGRITGIEGDPDHPISRGYICVKGRQYHEYVYHLDRLKYPMKRLGKRGEGKWQRISWDQALDEIAARVTDIKEEHGPEAIATINGTGPRPSNHSSALLAGALGSPNVASVDLHICYAPSLIAEFNTLGTSVMMEKGPDYASSNCIVVWGGNPTNSHPPRGMEILQAKRERNSSLIVVDPRRTPLAAQADLWLQVRPGTDAALALGMINTVIEERLYDEQFVERWCHGFDQLRLRAEEYPPGKVAEITWVPADKIREAARMYATTKPAVLHHRQGIEDSINSTQTCRALAILIALTGNVDAEGGNLISVLPNGYVDGGVLRGIHKGKGGIDFRPAFEAREKRIGADAYPLVSGPESQFPFVSSLLLVDAIATGKPYPVKGLFCMGGSPLNVQNFRKVWDALLRLDLHVAIDFFMTPTAEIADYVLPSAMWPEVDDCCDVMYTNCIAARQRAIEPLQEAWPDMKIAIELVKRLPWADRRVIPWDSVDELNRWRTEGLGISFEEFKARGYITEPRRYRKYEQTGFNTPTGKVELYSTVFERHGYDPLPSYEEAPMSPLSNPELMSEYPLVLISGSRYVNFFHSEGRQIASLRRLTPEPEIEIHPDTAREHDIRAGDWVWVETPELRGERVRLKARLTTNIHPKYVSAPDGWWFPEKPAPEHGCFESNINVVISDEEPRERICGSVPMRGKLCKVYK